MNIDMDFIKFLLSMPYQCYFSILVFLCMICGVTINPILFKFWIIPRIENRYHTTLIFDDSFYYYPGSKWVVPHLEISGYIVLVYIGFQKFANNKNSRSALKKINYDINTASRAEIVMSFISVFCIYGFLVFGLIVAMAGTPQDHVNKEIDQKAPYVVNTSSYDKYLQQEPNDSTKNKEIKAINIPFEDMYFGAINNTNER